jgi:hypothetical protein
MYSPRICPHISCSRIGSSIMGIYSINRSETHECGNCNCGREIPFLEIFVSNFLCTINIKKKLATPVNINDKIRKEKLFSLFITLAKNQF